VDDPPNWREDDVTRTDVPATRTAPAGVAKERVRIIGAEPAGEITGELPKVAPEGDEPDSPDGGPDGASEPSDTDSTDTDSTDRAALSGAGPLDEFEDEQPAVRLIDAPGDPEGASRVVDPLSPGQTAVPSVAPTELPHWTEPPTGQVPAVLTRDTGKGEGIEAPTWREGDADWVAHEELFEPAMFGDDEVSLGSLDETDRSDAERRPWEFDFEPASPEPASPEPTSSEPATAEPANVGGDARGVERGLDHLDEVTSHPITEPTEVVTAATAHAAAAGRPDVDEDLRSHRAGDQDPADKGGAGQELDGDHRIGGTEPAGTAAVSAAAAAEGFPGDGFDPSEAERLLPSGTARMGRARRSGLLPGRLRARQPETGEDALDVPLASDLPGASVTEVPGAGKKRRGFAGLAAADRSASREAERASRPLEGDAKGAAAEPAVAPQPATNRIAAAGSAAAAAAGTVAKRHRSERDRPPQPAPDQNHGPAGGPPVLGRSRRPDLAGGPAPEGSPIGLRVGTGLAAAVVALLAFKLGTVTSLALVVIVVTFAAGECFGVLRRAGYHPATLLGLVGTVSLVVGAYNRGIAALPLVFVLITVFTLVWYLFGIERGSPVAGTAATLLAVGWVSLLGSYAGLLLSPSSFPDRHGIAFLLGAIIATVANDVGALVIGGWIGRTPLAPKISPNKTWEGLFGGAVFSILISTVAVGAIHPWSASNAALLGVVVAVVAPIGDLCESLLKRDLRLKDMGTLLPGHGGVLDRVDALLFVLPATYYLVRALNIA